MKNQKIYGLVAFESGTGAMGKEGKLLWHLPSDLKHFKNLTKNQTVIMGRKTFDSIINACGSPLPQRENIVLSKKNNYQQYLQRCSFCRQYEKSPGEFKK